nr:MAG TPA: hypothetical protein [Caudoviricetes sp.]
MCLRREKKRKRITGLKPAPHLILVTAWPLPIEVIFSFS